LLINAQPSFLILSSLHSGTIKTGNCEILHPEWRDLLFVAISINSRSFGKKRPRESLDRGIRI